MSHKNCYFDPSFIKDKSIRNFLIEKIKTISGLFSQKINGILVILHYTLIFVYDLRNAFILGRREYKSKSALHIFKGSSSSFPSKERVAEGHWNATVALMQKRKRKEVLSSSCAMAPRFSVVSTAVRRSVYSGCV